MPWSHLCVTSYEPRIAILGIWGDTWLPRGNTASTWQNVVVTGPLRGLRDAFCHVKSALSTVTTALATCWADFNSIFLIVFSIMTFNGYIMFNIGLRAMGLKVAVIRFQMAIFGQTPPPQVIGQNHLILGQEKENIQARDFSPPPQKKKKKKKNETSRTPTLFNTHNILHYYLTQLCGFFKALFFF